jgi:hypothetical protein
MMVTLCGAVSSRTVCACPVAMNGGPVARISLSMFRGDRCRPRRDGSRFDMVLARHASHSSEQGRIAEARASEKVHYAVQNGRAARIVAGHAADAQDCRELLQMLGLDASTSNATVEHHPGRS